MARRKATAGKAEDLARAETLNREAHAIRHQDLARARTLAREALDLATRIGDRKQQAQADLNLGFCAILASAYDEAFVHLYEGQRIFEEVDHPPGVSEALYDLGVLFSRIGDYAKALEVHMRSLEIRRSVGDRSGVAACLGQIGYLNERFGKDAEAAKYYTESMAIREAEGDRAGIASIHMAMGILSTKAKDMPVAKEHFEKSIRIRADLKETSGWMISMNYMATWHQANGDHQKAVAVLQEALTLVGAQPDLLAPGLCRLLTIMATSHTELGNHVEACQRLDEALVLALRTDQKYLLHDIHRALSASYRAQGELEKALEHYEQFHAQKEVVNDLNANSKLRNLELLGSFEQERRAAEVTRAHNAALQAANDRITAKNKIIRAERKRSDALLLNILPAEVAEELKQKGEAEARQIDQVTVLFTDFKGFTSMAEQLGPKELVRDIHECFSAFDRIITKHGVEKIKTIGDAYMAAGGLPTPNATHAVDVVKAALEIRDFIAEGKARKLALGQPFFEIRIGIHTGPVVAGIVGVKKFAYDIWGDTVNTASRMESSGEVGQVNISEATYALVKDVVVGPQLQGSPATNNQQLSTTRAFTFTPRGKVQAKGKGEMEMYFVEG